MVKAKSQSERSRSAVIKSMMSLTPVSEAQQTHRFEEPYLCRNLRCIFANQYTAMRLPIVLIAEPIHTATCIQYRWEVWKSLSGLIESLKSRLGKTISTTAWVDVARAAGRPCGKAVGMIGISGTPVIGEDHNRVCEGGSLNA